jgi:Flp pilus assembly pilin Flp
VFGFAQRFVQCHGLPGEERGALTELVFLHRLPLALRVPVVLLLAVAVGIAGVALADAHVALSASTVNATTLNPLQRAIRAGSSGLTAWPGWVAAALFVVAFLRLRRGPVEPAAGRTPVEAMSAGQLRQGLRREYTVVRALLCVVLAIAAVDVSRTLATAFDASAGYAGGDQLLPMSLEALGYTAAAFALIAWAYRFAKDLRRLGAF